MEIKCEALRHTRVYARKSKSGEPYIFSIREKKSGRIIKNLTFQHGTVGEDGVMNGITEEDILLAVLARLESFQETGCKCKENTTAIKGIKMALNALEKRTKDREKRGVEGTKKP